MTGSFPWKRANAYIRSSSRPPSELELCANGFRNEELSRMNFVTWLQVVAAVTAGKPHEHSLLSVSPFVCVSSTAVSWNAAVAVPTLSLDPVFSPPSVIPTDPNLMVYNAPAMDHMLQEVRVLVRDSGGSLVTYPVTVTATTILSTNWNVVGNPGDMYNGTLCQHGRWFGRLLVCRYPYDDCIEMVCNTTDVVNYPLGQVTAETSNGVAAFPRFLHTVPSVANQRRLRFFATVEGVDLTAVTEPFDVQCKCGVELACCMRRGGGAGVYRSPYKDALSPGQ